jgi:hypothetical protein
MKIGDKKAVMSSFLYMWLLVYMGYVGGSLLCGLLLFYKERPSGLDDHLFVYLAIIEFLSVIFIRSRAALLFFP